MHDRKGTLFLHNLLFYKNSSFSFLVLPSTSTSSFPISFLHLSSPFCPQLTTLHKGAFCQFPFRWIYYYGSNESTGKETGKTHLCALVTTVHMISATTDQVGIKCTKAKEYLRAYCLNVLYCGRVVLIPKSVINCRLPIFLENGLCLHQPSRKNQNLTIFLMLEKEELLSQKGFGAKVSHPF